MEQQKPQVNLQADIAYLHNTTFSRQKTQEGLLLDLHVFLPDPKFARYFDTLYLLRSLLLEPYSLWAPDFIGMTTEVCNQLRATGAIDPLLVEIIHNYEDPPNDSFRKMVTERERCVQQGDYSWCVTERGQDKYVLAEQASFEDEEIKTDLASLKKHHDFAKYQGWSKEKVVRRRMTMERNFRSKDWKFKWETARDKYVEHLESVCSKHGLIGFRSDTPLLAKIAVYATPHALRIDIPWHSNPDIWRDLNLPGITEVLRSAGVERRGPKLIAMRQAMNKRAKLAYAAELEGIEQGYQGDELMAYVCEKAGLRPDMDEGNYRRTIRHGKELVEGKTAKKKTRPT
jgi:hypothetical protein